MKTLATLALVTLAVVAMSTAAKADAVSDQKKAYQALGIKIKPGAKLCKLLTKSEVERLVGGPVKDGAQPGPADGCYWAAAGPNPGLLVTREPGTHLQDYSRFPQFSQYKKINGVGMQAFTIHSASGDQADGLNAKGVTSVIVSGNGASAAKALAVLRIVINR